LPPRHTAPEVDPSTICDGGGVIEEGVGKEANAMRTRGAIQEKNAYSICGDEYQYFKQYDNRSSTQFNGYLVAVKIDGRQFDSRLGHSFFFHRR